jgi:hypothetical protein
MPSQMGHLVRSTAAPVMTELSNASHQASTAPAIDTASAMRHIAALAHPLQALVVMGSNTAH